MEAVCRANLPRLFSEYRKWADGTRRRPHLSDHLLEKALMGYLTLRSFVEGSTESLAEDFSRLSELVGHRRTPVEGRNPVYTYLETPLETRCRAAIAASAVELRPLPSPPLEGDVFHQALGHETALNLLRGVSMTSVTVWFTMGRVSKRWREARVSYLEVYLEWSRFIVLGGEGVDYVFAGVTCGPNPAEPTYLRLPPPIELATEPLLRIVPWDWSGEWMGSTHYVDGSFNEWNFFPATVGARWGMSRDHLWVPGIAPYYTYVDKPPMGVPEIPQGPREVVPLAYSMKTRPTFLVSATQTIVTEKGRDVSEFVEWWHVWTQMELTSYPSLRSVMVDFFGEDPWVLRDVDEDEDIE